MGGRAMRGFAWAGVISCCFLGFWTAHAGLAWVPFALVGGLCGVYLIFGGRRDKDGSRVLPSSLERLAYFSDETSVAFAWKWRRGRESRLRILRPDTRAAQSPEGASNDQTCVFDGSGQTLVIDHDVQSRRTYHYSIFVEDGKGRWSDPICQPVLTDAQAVRAAIEATYDGPQAGSPEAKALLRPRPFSTESSTTNEIAGAVTNLIFSAASVFAAARPSDGWEEVR